MPPYLASRDSPRTQHGRRRAPRGQLVRSNSLFGALKNIVTAPFSWLTTYDDHENVSGKRGRGINPPVEDEDAYHEDQPSAKRKRVDSPEPVAPTRTTQGYLDVPENLFVSRQRHAAPSGHGRSSSLVTSPLSVPAISGTHPARRTASPTGITSSIQPSGMFRTQSMDPPAYRAISLSRDVSMEDGLPGSVSRDVTMSPSRHTPFQLRARSSLTPQPTGQTFGPTPRHKERDASEPPPLAALISNPVFVKQPPQVTQAQTEQPLTTLGSLADANGRISRSPMRQHSSLFLGARPGSMPESRSTPFVVPVNAAEKALHDLDVYKTPLLPSRLRGSQTIPEMFKPKKAHAPVLMRPDREHDSKPRLGTSERKKGKKKDEETSVEASKPYAGRGGMKKMLARRRLEEQEELEKERANAIETDPDEIVQKEPEKSNTDSPGKVPQASSPPVSVPTRPAGGREQSSLRVGRTRISRSHHIARPHTKNRFSAVFDDDEGEDSMVDETREQQNTSGEHMKFPALFESPRGFTFAQDKAPVLQDSSNINTLPIPVLPFSLTKPATSIGATTTSSTQPFSFTTEVKGPAVEAKVPEKESDTTIAATPAPQFPPLPSISLIPPSPAPAKPLDEVSTSSASATTAPSVPNFFANSSIFSKPGVTVAPPTPSPTVPQETRRGAEYQSSLGDMSPSVTVPKESSDSKVGPCKTTEAPTFSYGSPGTLTSPLVTSTDNDATETSTLSSAPSNVLTSMKETNNEASTTLSTPFTFTPSKPAEQPPAPPKLPLNFAVAPTPSAHTITASVPASASTSTSTPFSFGQSKAEPSKGPELKPLFGASEPTKPSLFATSPPTPPFGGSQPGGEASKPAFTFGQPTSSSSQPTTSPTVEASKPLFPSTSTGGTGGFSFGSGAPAVSSPATPAKSPFSSFGAVPSTPSAATPIENKAAFTFGTSTTPVVSAPTTLFSGPSTENRGSDVSSKPFTFGAPTAARSLTPPHKEQDMRMEESPTRDGAMDMNGDQQPSLKPSKVFTFGTSVPGAVVSSPYGQSTTSPFSFETKNETQTKPEAKLAPSFANFGQSAPTAPFSFGQKSAENLPSPLSPAPFGASNPFGQSVSTTTSAQPAFLFGGTPSSGGFGSQPASPSTFGAPTTPFTWGATPTSATAPSNPFAFGSQPASPATGNVGLPQPPGSSGGPSFTFGAPSSATAPAPSSPFGAPSSLPTPGGASFTVGAAPPPASGPRQIKKLPNRRAGRR